MLLKKQDSNKQQKNKRILFGVVFKLPKLKGKGIIALGVLVVIELVQILCFS